MRAHQIVLTLIALILAGPMFAGEVNVYSSRKDALIVPLLDRFTERTRIEVNLITGRANA